MEGCDWEGEGRSIVGMEERRRDGGKEWESEDGKGGMEGREEKKEYWGGKVGMMGIGRRWGRWGGRNMED